MNLNTKLILVLLGLWFFQSCGTLKQAYVAPADQQWSMVELPDKPLVETLYLIGDAGEPEIDPLEPTLALLRKDVQAAGENSTVIFLGDNVYPVGLPQKEDPRRAEAELRLNQSIDAVNDLPAKVFFIPGNHDWNHEKSGGRKAVRRMEDYIEERLDRGDTFLPSNACGDPEVVKIDKDFRIIFIDSQWWLHNWDGEKKMNKGCEAKSRQEFLVLLEALLEKYKKDQILLVMHHPFYSNGNHGGHFSVQRNLFPLRAVDKSLWIPLPVIGSIEPVYRKINGTKQDATHRDVRELRDAIHGMLNESFKNVIFAAGHDHNLQYHNQLGHHFIVSGAGSKHAYTRKGLDATFSYESEGYVKLYYYASREVWMEIITPDENTGEAVVQFRKQLTPPKPEKDTEEELVDYPAFPDSVVHVATTKYRVSKFEQFLLGKNYRKVWETPVPAPIFDLQERGLTPIKKGGGNGTNSLRLEDDQGKQYVLRSVVKDPLRSIPPEFRNLKAIRFYTNFNSSNHPYAALPVPKMAEAAGIYYATPELVYLPKQEGLGIYNELFDEGLYFFEQRPSGDRSELDQFGNSEEIIGYIDLLAKLQKNQKHRVDQEWTLKSRLFDIYIHDWDRHDDQWRWASFDREGYTLYRPIPRDRDAAFYKFNGFFNKLISTFFMRKFKSMKGDLKDVPGQSTNAAFYDRHFLSEMDREDWLKAAKHLQTNLTDEVIEAAFLDWPDTLDAQYGEEIRGYLKQRRDNFQDIAMRQYAFLSKIVNVRGTNDDELFEITRGAGGETTVKVYELSKKGNKKDLLYDRTFYSKETKEIRLYGFGGKDDFKIEGDAKKGILIRIIGGFGKDEVENTATGVARGKTKVYDELDGMKLEGKVADKRSSSLEVNEYDREYYRYNVHLPLINFGFNPDDGFAIGAGLLSTLHGFRKEPYSAFHSVGFNVFTATGAFNFNYSGDFTGALGKADLIVDASILNPEFVNFFGFGTNSVNPLAGFNFNRVRLEHYRLGLSSRWRLNGNRNTLRFGPVVESISLAQRDNQITADPNFPEVPLQDFSFKHFAGANLQFSIDGTDGKANIRNGLRITADADYRKRLDSGDDNSGFLRTGGAFSLYLTIPIKSVDVTLASSVGGDYTFGDFEFYQAPSLGGFRNLRGYRNDRFRGHARWYHNTDLRLTLFYWDNAILPFEFGMYGGVDYGRIFFRDEENPNDDLFVGYAAGIFFNPLKFLVITPFMAFSEEQSLFNFQVGFSF